MSEISKIEQILIIKKIDNETINVQILDNNVLISVVGEFNKNLLELEKLTNTSIFFRGNSITIKGKLDNINKARDAIKFLINKFLLTNIIEKNDIILSVKKEINKNNVSNIQSFQELIKTPRKSVIARSKKQSEYIKALKEKDIVMALGPAGTGKSFLAVSVAITMLMEKKVERVILSRPAVEAGEKLGFLPGDLSQKVDPYLRPLYDGIYEMLGVERATKLIEKEVIEVAPLAYLRGRTLNNAFIIMDESQNTTIDQMKMFLTRMGYGSCAVVNGDLTQIDLPTNVTSGLSNALEVLSKTENIGVTKFNSLDVVRHPLVRKIIDAYEAFKGIKI